MASRGHIAEKNFQKNEICRESHEISIFREPFDIQ